MLECWKQRNGSEANYEVLAKAFLKINRTNLAEKIVVSARDAQILENTSNTQPRETNRTSSPSSGSGIETAVSNLYPSTVNVSRTQEEHVIPNPSELEEEFFKLVQFVEVTLKSSEFEVQLEAITRHFSMLPQSIRRRHQTDENIQQQDARFSNLQQSRNYLTI